MLIAREEQCVSKTQANILIIYFAMQSGHSFPYTLSLAALRLVNMGNACISLLPPTPLTPLPPLIALALPTATVWAEHFNSVAKWIGLEKKRQQQNDKYTHAYTFVYMHSISKIYKYMPFTCIYNQHTHIRIVRKEEEKMNNTHIHIFILCTKTKMLKNQLSQFVFLALTHFTSAPQQMDSSYLVIEKKIFFFFLRSNIIHMHDSQCTFQPILKHQFHSSQYIFSSMSAKWFSNRIEKIKIIVRIVAHGLRFVFSFRIL